MVLTVAAGRRISSRCTPFPLPSVPAAKQKKITQATVGYRRPLSFSVDSPLMIGYINNIKYLLLINRSGEHIVFFGHI